MTTEDAIRILRAAGRKVRRAGDGYRVSGVWPAILTPHAVVVLARSQQREVNGAS